MTKEQRSPKANCRKHMTEEFDLMDKILLSTQKAVDTIYFKYKEAIKLPCGLLLPINTVMK